MERMKKVIGDIVVYGVCLISLVAIMSDVFEWMLYVQDDDGKEKVPDCPL